MCKPNYSNHDFFFQLAHAVYLGVIINKNQIFSPLKFFKNRQKNCKIMPHGMCYSHFGNSYPDHVSSLLICTLISENQGLEKSRTRFIYAFSISLSSISSLVIANMLKSYWLIHFQIISPTCVLLKRELQFLLLSCLLYSKCYLKW